MSWQSLQRRFFERVPFTWTRCAPTPRAAAVVLPERSTGGEAATPSTNAVGFGVRVELPWQLAQDIEALRFTAPLRCVPPARMAPPASTLVSWHLEQVVIPPAVRWLAVAGGAPWQRLQLVGPRTASTLPSTWVAAATVVAV